MEKITVAYIYDIQRGYYTEGESWTMIHVVRLTRWTNTADTASKIGLHV